MAAHLAWRLTCFVADSADSSFVAKIAGLEMRATASGANECTGGTASASTEQAGTEASKAFDGSGATTWASTFGAGPHRLIYTRGTAFDVVELALTAPSDAPSALSCMPRAMCLAWSDNGGSSWTPHALVVTPTAWTAGETRVITLDTTSVTKKGAWKLAMTNTNSPYNAFSSVQMRAVAAGTNLATSGVAYASSTAGGLPATNAFDSNGGTDFATNAGADPETLGYFFATAPAYIAEIVATSRPAVGAQSPTSIGFYSSPDGETYTLEWPESGLTWTDGQSRTFTNPNAAPAAGGGGSRRQSLSIGLSVGL